MSAKSQSSPLSTSNRKFEQALSLLQGQKFALAEKRLLEVLQSDPGHVGALNVLALLLAQTGRHSKAEKYFIEAIRIFPSSDATYYNYGLALKALNRPAEALDMFSRSLAINPRSSDSWNNRGTVRSDLGGFQSAIADEVWMRLLAGIQGSVLRLSRTNDRAAANLRSAAQAHGIDPDRIVFASRVASLADHLARQRLADLFLDTLPYNAHSTANDAVRAGVPVLTCIGQAFAGRVAASMLRAVTLPELVARNLEEYEAMARRLAADPQLLQAIRGKLTDGLRISPLFDVDRYRRHIETAYAMMWERCNAGRDRNPSAYRRSTQVGSSEIGIISTQMKSNATDDSFLSLAAGYWSNASGGCDAAAAGPAREAEKIYARMLKAVPDQFDALNLLGTVKLAARAGRRGLPAHQRQRSRSIRACRTSGSISGSFCTRSSAIRKRSRASTRRWH